MSVALFEHPEALFRLQGAHYVVHAAADFGETLRSAEPFTIEIDTTALLDF